MPAKKKDEEEEEDNLLPTLQSLDKTQKEILKSLKELSDLTKSESEKMDSFLARLAVIENIPILQSHIRTAAGA